MVNCFVMIHNMEIRNNRTIRAMKTPSKCVFILVSLQILFICGHCSAFVQQPLSKKQQRVESLVIRRGLDSNFLAEATDMIPNVYDGVLSKIIGPNVGDNNSIVTIIGSYFLVTASDMIPFVPCQPLAIALGAKLGFSVAFPITTAGQTTAGILAFTTARRAASSDLVQNASNRLNPEAMAEFENFQKLTSREEQDDRTILLGLIGLRLAPFFPFSAGNYLLGGATAVPLSLYIIATLFGCVLSNFLSTSVGSGGAAIVFSR